MFTRLRSTLDRLLGRPIERRLTAYQREVRGIDGQEEALARASDGELRKASGRLRERAREGEPLESLRVETFALVREAARRTLKQRAYEVQLIAGLALHDGRIAEMQTGEGKTLAAVPAAALEALLGRGVHILTFNDYLARRDAAWMGPVFERLGLSVGCIQAGLDLETRQKAYAADITYGTAKEIGFDFLRDHLARRPEHLALRGHHSAIVDEADSLLIDEARVPLVIAASAEPARLGPEDAHALVSRLDPGRDFDHDAHARNAYFTEQGFDRLERRLGIQKIHEDEHLETLSALSYALQARELVHRDVDYIVRDGRIELIDEFTGRVVRDRRWPDGLQAAVEAKEGLELQPQGEILGSITLQHFFAQYTKLAGMTATAVPAVDELKEFYDVTVVVIPPNVPSERTDEPDRVFATRKAKQRALVEEIRREHHTGRPILVGTGTVRESEDLAEQLRRIGLAPEVLNAKNDEAEAAIIAAAGDLDAVTIATNMAGRGTDIRLGGEDEGRKAAVLARGGLLVIGTNRHESRRIDDQLRGRAGRQGDPGTSRFFVSLEDPLLELYGVRSLIPVDAIEADELGEIHDPRVFPEIERTQRIIQNENFVIRKQLWKYSHLVEQQRRQVQNWRQRLLAGDERPTLLAARSPERSSQLTRRFGSALVESVERDLTLAEIDRHWKNHLAEVAHVREGVHLISMGGRTPHDEFHAQIGKAFRRMHQSTDDAIVATFEKAEVTEDGIDLEAHGLRGPSSTWTYLVTDSPLGGWKERLMRGIFDKLRQASGWMG